MPIALSLAIKLKQTWSRLSQAKLRPLISFVMASSSAAGGGHENAEGHHKPNRLIHEKSPYLLQHAHNPVDWYPWGPEAFEKAKRENKLIFLSVGYSTCHWCHVMERESFEDPAIGAIMNSNFVNIKVDREERPDVDKIYMSFVQATTGSGGWPMSVWLTPDLKPIVGGTYFPPDDRYFGRPGFSSILKFVSQQWHEKPEDVTNQGTALTDALIQASTANASSTDTAMPDLDVVERCYSMIGGSFDPLWGGFGNAPKFPQPVNFEFMLRYAHHKEGLVKMKQSKPLEMVSKTLQMMSRGGIHDHVAQGFHRYSTDKKWHVPHFEKMLYDQGQLAVVFAEMFQVTGDPFYAEIVDDILSYVSRDLSHPEGGFYSAEDADSLPTADAKEKKEGAFCVWTDEDVRATLCDPIPGHEESELTVADVFCKHYSVSVRGNLDPYQDPHGELLDQNVLIVLGSLKETAEAFKLDESKTKEILKDACKKLFEVRCQRPKPHLDTKVLLAWNGLMISGFAKAGAILERAEYVDRAVKAAEFVRKHLTTPDGRLLRSVYAGEDKSVVQLEIPVLAFADDYAFFLTALLDLYDATLDPKWVNWAHELQERMNTLFWDSENWGYFTSSSGDPSIIIRLKEDQDGAEPSSNSVAAVNLLRLSALLDQEKYREQAKKILMAFGKRLVKVPVILPKLICAYLLYIQGPFHLVVVGPKELEGTKELLKAARSFFVPNRIVIHLEDPAKGVSFGGKELEFLKGLELVEGKPTCYPCKGFTCQRPVTSAAELLKILQEK